MKIPRSKFVAFVLAILILSLLLSGCGSTVMASSWTGVASDGTLAYVTKGTDLFAVSMTNGSLVWRFPEKSDAKKGFYSNPVVSPDGQILVAGYDHSLYSLNNNGVLNWTFAEAKNRLVGSPLATIDAIYQPSTDHNLYCLDLQGKLKWTFSAEQAIWATPVLDGDTLFVSSMDHNLYALNKDSGSRIWSSDLGGALIGSPLLSQDGVLYIGTLNKNILAVSAKDGSILWKTPISGSVWGTPILVEDSIYFGDTEGKFYRVNTADGAIVWQMETDGLITGSPAAVDGNILVGTEAGSLIAFDKDGKSPWKQTINGKLYTGLVVTDNLVLVGVTSGEQLLVAYNTNGSQAWPFTTPK